MRTLVVRITILCTLWAAAGCGSGGGNSSPPPPAGPTTKSYQLSVTGTPGSGQAGGLQCQLVLPAGIELATNSQDQTLLPSSLALSGNAPSGAILEGMLASGVLTVALVSGAGLADGVFAVVTAGIPAGASAPPASAWTVRSLSVIDQGGAPLDGVTLTVSASP